MSNKKKFKKDDRVQTTDKYMETFNLKKRICSNVVNIVEGICLLKNGTFLNEYWLELESYKKTINPSAFLLINNF